jgi:hypothetical protein
MNKIFSIIITTVLFLSCSQDKQAATTGKPSSEPASGVSGTLSQPGPAVYALELLPKEATRKSTLYLRTTGLDLSGAKIEWLVNGRPFTPLVPTQFDGADAAKGVAVQARVVVGGREVASNVVQIMNAPPEIVRLKVMPEVFKPRDVLSVETEGKDIDGDAVSFLYEWTRNGEPAGKGSRIETPIKRGDKVSVKVTPFDGENYGVPVVMNREIRNMPPVIVENKEFIFDGKACSYQVKASDPDEDTLQYSLEQAPGGMTIDKSTGLIKWSVPPDFKGEMDVSIIVNDGQGGIARCGQKITIK